MRGGEDGVAKARPKGHSRAEVAIQIQGNTTQASEYELVFELRWDRGAAWNHGFAGIDMLQLGQAREHRQRRCANPSVKNAQ
jgi:hypothetical protein